MIVPQGRGHCQNVMSGGFGYGVHGQSPGEGLCLPKSAKALKHIVNFVVAVNVHCVSKKHPDVFSYNSRKH